MDVKERCRVSVTSTKRSTTRHVCTTSACGSGGTSLISKGVGPFIDTGRSSATARAASRAASRACRTGRPSRRGDPRPTSPASTGPTPPSRGPSGAGPGGRGAAAPRSERASRSDVSTSVTRAVFGGVMSRSRSRSSLSTVTVLCITTRPASFSVLRCLN